MNEVRTLVFDLDGTLAETAGDLIGALNFVLAGEGIEAVPFSAARSLLGAGGRALIQRGYARAGRDLTPAKLDVLFGRFLTRYNAHIADHSWLFPGVAACLDACVEAGWRLAVCTNKFEHSSHLLLGALGVADRFQFVCGQDTFGVAKPDPRPLVETIRKVGGVVGRAIMVGDSRDRHPDRAGGGNARHRGGFWLYRRSRERTRARSGDLAFRWVARGGGGARRTSTPALT